ncbi:hypothetical protein Hanom_Chr09g00788071 [Helianthus anomalus]
MLFVLQDEEDLVIKLLLKMQRHICQICSRSHRSLLYQYLQEEQSLDLESEEGLQFSRC